MTSEDYKEKKQKAIKKVFEDISREFALRPCNCICHRETSIRHSFKCCTPCDYCGLNVSIGQMEYHLEYCEKRD